MRNPKDIPYNELETLINNPLLCGNCRKGIEEELRARAGTKALPDIIDEVVEEGDDRTLDYIGDEAVSNLTQDKLRPEDEQSAK